jgi:hypothetical protein
VGTRLERAASKLDQILGDLPFGYFSEWDLPDLKPAPKGVHTAEVLTDGMMSIPLAMEAGRKRREMGSRRACLQASKDRRTNKKRGEHTLLLSALMAGNGAALTGLCRMSQARMAWLSGDR